jgi:hypothetical protein
MSGGCISERDHRRHVNLYGAVGDKVYRAL